MFFLVVVKSRVCAVVSGLDNCVLFLMIVKYQEAPLSCHEKAPMQCLILIVYFIQSVSDRMTDSVYDFASVACCCLYCDK